MTSKCRAHFALFLPDEASVTIWFINLGLLSADSMGSKLFLKSCTMFRQALVQKTRGFATSNVAVEGFTGAVGNTPLVRNPKEVTRLPDVDRA
jgi:hypothetical protein